MNFQFYIEKLIDSEEFRDFKKENPEAYLCSGFFSVDKKGNDNQQHLDYFVPGLNKVFSFKLGSGPIEKIPVEDYGVSDDKKIVPGKIGDNYDFDFSNIEEIVLDKMKEENISKKVEKFLVSLQKKDGGDFLVVNVFLSGLGMVNAIISLDKMEITHFEKKSFFDMLKVVKK